MSAFFLVASFLLFSRNSLTASTLFLTSDNALSSDGEAPTSQRHQRFFLFKNSCAPTDVHLDGVLEGVELLHAVYLLDNLVLQSSERKVSLREEITRTACRVEEAKLSHLILQLVQTQQTLLDVGLLLTRIECR